MKQKSNFALWYTLALVAGLSLSGCASISQAVSSTVSALTPSQQQTAESQSQAPEPVQSPVPVQPDQVQKSSIRVEAAPPAPKGEKKMEVNLGDNKKCTTFCALPLRKPAP